MIHLYVAFHLYETNSISCTISGGRQFQQVHPASFPHIIVDTKRQSGSSKGGGGAHAPGSAAYAALPTKHSNYGRACVVLHLHETNSIAALGNKSNNGKVCVVCVCTPLQRYQVRQTSTG